MTREEAIKILKEGKRQNEAILGSPNTFFRSSDMPDGIKNAKQRIEALDMAVSALRDQQAPAKLDREQWEGCGLCKKASRISGSAFVHYGHEEVAYEGLTFSYMKYCPRCGRPLTEEACAEPERRIGGNDGTTD